MIAALRGKVLAKYFNRVIVDVQGVGYDVAVSLPTLEGLTHDGEVFFHVYTALRENSLELYGFVNPEEKSLFEMLISVSGIGPRMAITILSGISPESFAAAVLEGNGARLTAIPGIGKKSAERIILELKEKLKRDGLGSAFPGGNGSIPSLEEDLVSSLIHLGYSERQARGTARSVMEKADTALDLTSAVKLALKDLVK